MRALLLAVPVLVIGFWFLWRDEPAAPRAPQSPVAAPAPAPGDSAPPATAETRPRVPRTRPDGTTTPAPEANGQPETTAHSVTRPFKDAALGRDQRRALGSLRLEFVRTQEDLAAQLQKGEITLQKAEQLLDEAIAAIDQRSVELLKEDYARMQPFLQASHAKWREEAMHRFQNGDGDTEQN